MADKFLIRRVCVKGGCLRVYVQEYEFTCMCLIGRVDLYQDTFKHRKNMFFLVFIAIIFTISASMEEGKKYIQI